MNLSESLGWMKVLKARHNELVTLRNGNVQRIIMNYGQPGAQVQEPRYDAIKLDKRITLLAREMRLLDESIKRTNARTEVDGFQRNDDVLGELESA